MRRIRIAQFGLGPIGRESLRLAAERPDLEVIGTVEIDPALAGRPGLNVHLHGGVAGDDATVAALLNVIPSLLAAPAGVRLLTELPLTLGRGSGSVARLS